MKYFRPPSIFFLICFTTFAFTSCADDVDDNLPCTGPEVAGLDVVVKDAVTDDVLTTGVTVKVVQGGFQADLTEVDGHFIGLYDQQGAYDLTVIKSGYQTYTEEDVLVFKPGCHSITTTRNVALQPN